MSYFWLAVGEFVVGSGSTVVEGLKMPYKAVRELTKPSHGRLDEEI
jgi:hypothetical protein